MAARSRFRAGLVIASSWAVIWSVLGVGVGAALVAVIPAIPELAGLDNGAGRLAAFFAAPVVMGLRGLVTGGIFASLLARLERGRHAEELSTARVLLWANTVGLLWSFVYGVAAILVKPDHQISPSAMLLSLLGHGALVTVSALSTLWLVRRRAHGDTTPFGASAFTAPDEIAALGSGATVGARARDAYAPEHLSR